MRATVLTPLILLGWSLQAIGQSPARPSGEQPALQAQSPAASDNELKLVVALFRHGVRAPLPGFEPDKADKYSGQRWPSIDDWKVPPGKTWGDLTTRGQVLASGLGSYYAGRYKNAWPAGLKVYLWADTDQRTIDTANALNQGFQQKGVSNVTVNSAPEGPDPLFHPFQAGCGTPDAKTLAITVANINKGRKQAAQKLESSFDDLYGVLDSKTLKLVIDSVSACKDGDCSPKCESPIAWCGMLNEAPSPGIFPYASSASEAFLLEYANSMPANLVGWKRVDAAKNLHSMLQLHEAYFELTERQEYLAQIQGSNLIREILDQLDRKAKRPVDGQCPRAEPDSDFVGLVGHDTNLASINRLLKLEWNFNDTGLPPDTFGLPANDALPAGALVFELRQRNDGYWVRVEYVTQSLDQMRNGPVVKAFRLGVDGAPCEHKKPCEMQLTSFEQLVRARRVSEFLSGCTNTVPREQSCSGPTGEP